MPLRLERMTGTEVVAADKGKAVVFLVVSGLEDHGPHLPLNSDLLEAEALAERVAQLAEASSEGYSVYFYPACALAVDLTTSRLAIRVRGHVLRDYLIDVCDGLYRMGFRHFVCFTASYSPRHLTAIEEAGQWMRRKHRKLLRKYAGPTLVSASAVLPDDAARSESSVWMNPPEHGGARDTSMILAVDPQAVRPMYRELPPYQRLSGGLSRFLEKARRHVEGYWGEPSGASVERGRTLLEERAKEIYPKLRAVWTGSNPLTTLKSWYSALPVNRTIFPIWILLLALLVLGALWLGALLQTVTERATM